MARDHCPPTPPPHTMSINESRQMVAEAEQIFAIYAQVTDWPAWDPDLQAAGIDGPFTEGSTGWIKPRGAPRMKTRIIALAPDRSFTAEARLPLCRMVFTHTVEPVTADAGSPVSVTHGVDFKGWLAPVYRLILARQIKRTLLPALQGLQHRVEARPPA